MLYRQMAPKNDGAQAVLDEVVVWDSDGKATKEEAEAALPDDKVSYLSLFRYASRSCRLLIALAGILGIVQGASLPALLYLFGDSLNAFGTVDPAEEINALVSHPLFNHTECKRFIVSAPLT